MRFPLVLIACAFVGLLVGYQPPQAASQVEVPSDVVSVPSPVVPVSFPEPVVDPMPFVAEDEVCVDGSCSVAAASGPVASVAQAVTGPVRRVVQAKPVRRVVGRVFSRLRGCR